MTLGMPVGGCAQACLMQAINETDAVCEMRAIHAVDEIKNLVFHSCHNDDVQLRKEYRDKLKIVRETLTDGENRRLDTFIDLLGPAIEKCCDPVIAKEFVELKA